MSEVSTLAAIPISEHSVRKAQLREDENRARDVERQIVLMVNQQRGRSDGRRRGKQVSGENVDRGSNQQDEE